jgi:hypothetical protein|tara:strand:+ start:626 stop:922 length:297 start_codon:yes stop_codon:yes gene_type:complete
MSVNRYQSTSQTKDGRYNTTRYPSFPKRQTDLYIISRELDRLDLLSNQFYEDPRFWWVLAKANNLGKGSLDVPKGIQLRIPYPITDLTVNLRDIEANK